MSKMRLVHLAFSGNDGTVAALAEITFRAADGIENGNLYPIGGKRVITFNSHWSIEYSSYNGTKNYDDLYWFPIATTVPKPKTLDSAENTIRFVHRSPGHST